MKTLSSLLVLALLQLGILHAQQPAATPAVPATAPTASQQPAQPGQLPARFTKEMRAKMETARMKSQLALTDSQVVKVEKIALKYAELNEELQKKMMELRVKQMEEIKPLLTPEQLEKLSKPAESRMRPPVPNNTTAPVAAPAEAK